MDKQKFKAMLIFLIPQLVKEIVDRENISETEATRALYESELYAALEEEEQSCGSEAPRRFMSCMRRKGQRARFPIPRRLDYE